MNAHLVSKGLMLGAALLLVAGCAPTQAKKIDYVGTLAIDGNNAFVNERPAVNKMRIHSGDYVSTGPGTSVKIMLTWGGYVQLDENTDPLFELITEGACLLVQVARGQAYVDAQNVCIDDSKNLQSNTHSKVNLRTDGNYSELTVIEGHVTVRSPTSAELGANDQYVRDQGGRGYQRRLSTAEATATIAWTQNYFQRTSRNDAATAAVITGIFGALLWEHTHKPKDNRVPTPVTPSDCAARNGIYMEQGRATTSHCGRSGGDRSPAPEHRSQ